MTTNVYVSVEPATMPVGVPACLTRLMLGLGAIGVSVASLPVTTGPLGGVAETVAAFARWPASTSAWVSVYVAEQVTWAFGASDATGQETTPTTGSEIAIALSVTLPVFVTTNVYGSVEPSVVPDSTPACLSTVTLGFDDTGVSVESVPVTAAPVGGVAETVAVFSTCPASTSACISVYVAVHVVVAFGASVVTGQVTPPAFGSETVIAPSVTLPVFLTTKLYGSVEPAVAPDSVPACLSSVMLGAAAIGVSTESVADTGSPTGGVTVAIAVLVTWPASTSAWVSAWEAVHVVCAPGASVVTVQVTVPAIGSAIVRPCTVTLPVFVTRNVYGTLEPAVAPDAAPACLSSVMLGVAGTRVSMVSVTETGVPDGCFAEAVAVLAT